MFILVRTVRMVFAVHQTNANVMMVTEILKDPMERGKNSILNKNYL